MSRHEKKQEYNRCLAIITIIFIVIYLITTNILIIDFNMFYEKVENISLPIIFFLIGRK